MRVASLFSGGKDSTFATYLTKKQGNEISCLVSVFSENRFSYMFHTFSISCVEKQAEVMGIPLIKQRTRGEKELELEDLKKALMRAKNVYGIDGVVTGAVESVYQLSRIEKVCSELGLGLISPLWKMDHIKLLESLIEEHFEVIVTGVAAYPLTREWLGRRIDKNFIEDVKQLKKKYEINPVGEGGEFETLVLNCPLFKRRLKVVGKKIFSSENAFWMDVRIE